MESPKNKLENEILDFFMNGDSSEIKSYVENELGEEIDASKYAAFIKQTNFKAKAKHNKAKDLILLDKIVNNLWDKILANTESPVSILKTLDTGGEPTYLFRNLDKISKEDLVDLIKDKNLVDVMEKLDIKDEIK